MADPAAKKVHKGFWHRLGMDSGIRRRWFFNSISIVLLVLFVIMLAASLGEGTTNTDDVLSANSYNEVHQIVVMEVYDVNGELKYNLTNYTMKTVTITLTCL